MKAYVYRKYGSPDEVKSIEREVPSPKKNELLIKVKAIGLNPLDYRIRRGSLRPFTNFNFPRQIASDFSGEVVEVGGENSSYNIGDLVYGMVFQLQSGASAEYIVSKEENLFHAPKSLKLEEAASVPLAAQTSLQALRDIAQLKKGMRVLINGASGGVGTFAIGLSKIFEAHVTAVTSFRNISLVNELGSDEVIDYTKNDFTQMKGSFDVIFDCWGNKNFNIVKDNLTSSGVYVSTIPNSKNFFSTFKTSFTSKKGKVVLVRSKKEDLAFLKKVIESRELKVVIEKSFSQDKIIEAYKHLETKRTRGKVIVVLN
ncbi:MAG: zinc-binding alcohol dehydrogenase [Halobacteriovoraceae bacterium]|nr:zinc-binding alcohol dehydrogenase [Halobacteriovoraceae bacterium]|tara:strand:- start:503 stop:1444 length:942 start_codon:yes stop_codon:yes gene_type:complete